jgi:heme/copper-type cytochrome/quinol oxidase subunit 2
LTIELGKENRITILATKAGTYEFYCDLFCGEGHEGMTGRIIAENGSGRALNGKGGR